ncbi:MAG: DUF6567 family protein [Paludibacteraceae bacterium]
MKKMKMFMAIAIGMFLASCAGINTTAYPTMDMNQTNVILDGAKYKVIGNVEGRWSATYIFTIGGYRKTANEANSRSEMFKNADLKDNQAVINISTTTSYKTVIGIWTKYTSISTGQVIEFIE